jgi:hypothetical protein
MTMDALSELAQFHEFLSEKLVNGGSQLSPEEALDAWRTAHPSAEVSADDYEAVRQALAAMDAGDTGLPFEGFDREFRARHKLPPRE